ncbi:X-ray radiation resistance-associated protein 1 isoform X2 [Aplysia californica]|uniref:X-ray radiation resistance-associated protein 1 isoform X2 n=1 Tax=Aplysia californica TaxID=6500 RepID=A0ABM1VY08_APLCA|nr:X-ray radiation resistance-associated protein 1 isoform X2 [Aplysia californica]
MALAGVKLDDGRGGFASNCFPVRPGFGKTSDDASGAWLIAHHAEQRRRFKAVLCTKPRTYARIKEERKKSELTGTKLDAQKFEDEGDQDEDGDDEEKFLDGFFLMKHCCVEDPADLCSVNIAGKELTDVKEDDLALFENVAYVNAGENYLPFEAFRGFPALRELEIPLNGLRSLQIDYTDFNNLEMLDLSYNNLSQDDLLCLGLLSQLKVLHLTGNHFTRLPQDMAMPYLSREKNIRFPRYSKLEVLLLDDNQLMEMNIFAALAGLPKLRHLNMSKNEIFFVPQLKSVEGRVVTQDGKDKKRPRRPGSGRRSSRRSKSRAAQEASLIDLEVKASEVSSSGKNPADGKGESSSEVKEGSNVATEKSGTQVTEGSHLQDLLAEDFTSGDLSARIQDLDLETSRGEEVTAAVPEKSEPQMPPFPELRYLNLSYNKICEEDALLAVAAWPMLMELDIYQNPLTTERSGDPPLLRRFLQDRLHIKLNRSKPDDVVGFLKTSKVEIRPKNIKIQEVVPKVPRLTVEEKMRLELPPPPLSHAIEHGSSPVPMDFHGKKKMSVLPPIPTTPKEELTEAWAERIMEEEEEEDEDSYSNEREDTQMSAAQRDNSDTFFMTQPDDIEAKHSGPRREPSVAEDRRVRGKVPEGGQAGAAKVVDGRYKGYELLLDIEELENEPELPPAKDIQGNIRALKHTLSHQLVYRDPAIELSKVKKMVQEYRRAPVPPAKPHQSYQERIDDALENLKTRSIVEEEKLTTVLKDRSRLRKQFPEADNLLGQIQRKYNAVRVHSLKDAKQAKQITESVLNLLPDSKPVAGK